MKIEFMLNGSKCGVEAEPATRLINVLRLDFGLLGSKAGCLSGRCGVCSILFNGEVVKACLTPMFKVRGARVLTIEGFALQPEYQDIEAGFYLSGVKTCGYCLAGKILATEALLSNTPQPSPQDALRGLQDIKCRCTEPDALVSGILAAADLRRRRLYGRG